MCMKDSIWLSTAEIAYLLYMFWVFKTNINFNTLLGYNVLEVAHGHVLWHSLRSDFGVKICAFGQWAILPMCALLLLPRSSNLGKKTLIAALALSAVLSLMNMNAVVYLVPIWIVELWRFSSS